MELARPVRPGLLLVILEMSMKVQRAGPESFLAPVSNYGVTWVMFSERD